MPGTYVPIVSTYSNGVVEVKSTDGTSYAEIQQSLGTTTYEVSNVYYKANNNAQLLNPLRLKKYDAEGNFEFKPKVIAIDPRQFISAINLDFSNDDVILNGQLIIRMKLLSNQQVMLVLDVIERSPSDWLPKSDILNNDFFRDYNG